MCRLYGFRANEPTKVECTLVYAQNALLRQSRLDSRGVSNPDGWGIEYYENGSPRTVRRATSAFSDVHFSAAAERVLAETVVAHVRQATLGENELANTHPFLRSPWISAHNGTVRGIEELRPRLLTAVQRQLAAEPAGTTDSELAFYWLLSRFVEAGIDVDEPARDLQRLVPSREP